MKQNRLPLIAIIAGGSLLFGAEAALAAAPTSGTVSASAPSAAANSAASAGTPFILNFSGTAGFAGPTTSVFTGSGLATHMGRLTSVGHADVLAPDDAICSGGVPNTHYETFTAADGDTLSIVSDDVACPTAPGKYHGVGDWRVSGGTGRFSGASGQGAFDGHSDFLVGTFEATLSGAIVLHG